MPGVIWLHLSATFSKLSECFTYGFVLHAAIETIKRKTKNIALILPPNTEQKSLERFPENEQEILYLDEIPALMCLYFGNLKYRKNSKYYA